MYKIDFKIKIFSVKYKRATDRHCVHTHTHTYTEEEDDDEAV